MAGQCQFIAADQPKNVVKCSSVAVKKLGNDSLKEDLEVVLQNC
jgi:hypothetical protein